MHPMQWPFYLECCNVKPNDIDLIKKSCKCANCIRRGSGLHDEDVISAAISAISNEVFVGSKASAAATVDDGELKVLPSKEDIDNGDILRLIFPEMHSLKLSNNDHRKEVRSLASANDKLHKLVSSLHADIAALTCKLNIIEAT